MGRKKADKCKKGHELKGENLMPMINGYFRCRACAYDYQRTLRAFQKMERDRLKRERERDE